MKLYTSCPVCLKELFDSKPMPYINLDECPEVNVYNPINNMFATIATCSKGHKYIQMEQAFPFELLFQTGLYALANGYYLESILGFKAALERFYEFYIKIIAKSQGIEQSQLTDSYKKINKLSERELGAYVYAYLIENKKAPKLLCNKYVKLRNNVFHSGHFPSKDEAYGFAKEIHILILEPYIDLLANHNELIFKHLHEIQNEWEERLKKQNPEEFKNGRLLCSNSCFPLCIHHTRDLSQDLSTDIETLIGRFKINSVHNIQPNPRRNNPNRK